MDKITSKKEKRNQSTPIDRFVILQEVPVFEHIPIEILWHLSEKSIEVDVERLEWYIEENVDPAGYFYILVDGIAMISNSKQKIADMDIHSFYGHDEIITGEECYVNSLQLISKKARFLKLHKRTVLSLFNSYPEFAVELSKFLSKRVLENSSKLAEEARKNRDIEAVLNRFDTISKELLRTMGRDEIERKYLLKDNFDVKVLEGEIISYEKIDIIQAYIKIEGDNELRVRKYGNGYFRTEKSGTGKARRENEEAITEDEFKKEIKEIAGIPIEKDRYKINDPKYREIVIDIYKGKFVPLKIAEVEFITNEDSLKFKPPKWLSKYIEKEVTEDKRYKNKNLFLNGRP